MRVASVRQSEDARSLGHFRLSEQIVAPAPRPQRHGCDGRAPRRRTMTLATPWAAKEAWTVKLETGSRAIRRAESGGSRPRLEVRGKFFFAGDEKVPLRGVTYGPFAPDADGYRFPAPAVVERDLALITELGANCLRPFTPPPRWLLDMAAECNLWVLVGIPWAEHVCFLDSEEIPDVVRKTVSEVVEALPQPSRDRRLPDRQRDPARHRPVVRRRSGSRGSCASWCGLIKVAEPTALVSYANFPSTEYLDTRLHSTSSPSTSTCTASRVPALPLAPAEPRRRQPLVLTEFGIDSIRDGENVQAEMLSWHAPRASSWAWPGRASSPTPTSGSRAATTITDWAFGLVTASAAEAGRSRRSRRSTAATRCRPCPDYPKVSVVICAYNAEPHHATAASSRCRTLDYPDFEVIVVNDGSTDAHPEIAAQLRARLRVIHQENKGLSRGAQRRASRPRDGEIVVFTDSDCVVDPDWLHYLVAKLPPDRARGGRRPQPAAAGRLARWPPASPRPRGGRPTS